MPSPWPAASRSFLVGGGHVGGGDPHHHRLARLDGVGVHQGDPVENLGVGHIVVFGHAVHLPGQRLAGPEQRGQHFAFAEAADVEIELGGDVFPVFFIELGIDHLPLGDGDDAAQLVENGRHIGGGEAQDHRFARGHVGQVIDGHEEERGPTFDLAVLGRRAAAFGVCWTRSTCEPDHGAKLPEAIAHRAGRFVADLEIQDRR